MPERDPNEAPAHVFISYVREDAERVDRLQGYLEAAGILVWRDTSLRPGENWETAIRAAINAGTIAFVACFSENSERRRNSYQYAELRLAIKEMQRRLPGEEWLIPVRFAPCELPYFELGLGYTLDSLQRVDLFGDSWEQGASSLADAIRSMLEPTVAARGPSLSPVTTSRAQESHGQVVSSGTSTASETLGQHGPTDSFDHDVFLLFASPGDLDIARRIQMELTESGYSVWWDEGQLIASEDFHEIGEAITSCRFLIIILSSAFVNSAYSRNELSPETVQLIEQASVTVIPALYEMCPVPLALEPKEFSNFTTSPNKGLGELLMMLRSIEGKIPRQQWPTLRDAVNKLIARINEAPELYVATDLGGTKAYISIMTREGDRLFDRKFTTRNHGDALRC